MLHPKPIPRPFSPLAPTTPIPTTPTFGQSVKDGIGLGIGSGLGHAFVNRIFGPTMPTVSSHGVPPTPPKEPCQAERKAFETCLLSNTDVCHNQQMSLTQCLQLSKKDLE
jgi:hypothetical protein